MKRAAKLSEPPTLHVSLFTLHGCFRLIGQLIEHRLELQADGLKHPIIGFAGDPERGAKEEEAPGEWIRDHVAIPARKKFFFEQANTMGTMGSPVALANCTTPSLATWRGPLGPSGVTPRSQPDRPNLINARKAVAPPLVLDPRTA